MKRFYSPLRYPGGKQQLADYVKQLISINKLYDGIYVEPYAGGAGIALDLLISEYVRDIHLNDLDKNIYSFWYCVVNESEEMIDRLLKTPATIDNWELQHAILVSNDELTSIIDRAFATLFLNRCNRSGILDGGPIGGKAQTGKWKINARYNAPELADRIRRIARYKGRIQVSNKDCLDFLESEKNILSKRQHLIYMDPPYYIKGQDLYLNAYKPEDHIKIRNYVRDNLAGYNWIVSYDACDPIANLYEDFKCSEQILNYSASKNHTKGREFMFYQDNLKIPDDVFLINPVKYLMA